MPKNKCSLNDRHKKQYPFLETTKTESDVYCKKCKGSFSIATGGEAAIKRHVKTVKHLDAMQASSSSKSIDSHFSSAFDSAMAAMEGTWAYHIINANHSFQSSDCATKIFRTCFRLQNFSCSQKKCQSIVLNVFAPKVIQMLQNDLKQCRYVTIYTDASNHGNIKLFPVLVRYFIPTIGVCVKVLDMTSDCGETSEIINALILAAADKYALKNKIVAFCGDNAKVNFGGDTRGGEKNVYARVKKWVPHLIGIGCVAHITDNALKFACDTMPFDVECVIVKIYSYFYIHTTHVAALSDFCEIAGIEYLKLLGYAKTKFLAFGPAIKRVLHLYDALKKLFFQLPKGEKLLKTFFNDPVSKFCLTFVQEQADLFADYVLKIEGDEVTVIEIVQYLDDLKRTLKRRQEDKYLSPTAAAEKDALIANGHDFEILSFKCSEFFDDACDYINKWAAPMMELKMYSWAMLRSVPVWKDVEATMKKLNEQKLYDATQNSSQLHQEFGFVQNYCSDSKIQQWKNEKIPITKRWVEVFTHLDNENCEFKEMGSIIEYILCLPGSTASAERVFSAMNKTWTAEKTQLKVETLKAILMIKVNLKMSCLEFNSFIKSQPDMLRQISSKSKYKVRADEEMN